LHSVRKFVGAGIETNLGSIFELWQLGLFPNSNHGKVLMAIGARSSSVSPRSLRLAPAGGKRDQLGHGLEIELRFDMLAMDVARTHQFAVAIRNGNWEMVETPELKQAKEEMKRLSEEFEPTSRRTDPGTCSD
jgi:hypothetical protein